MKEVYYTTESGKEYSREDFIRIAKGNETIADMIFSVCTWQHPETVFEEGVIEGEWTEDGQLLPQD